jgi:hypothetical protein
MDATSPAMTALAMILPGVHNFESEGAFCSTIFASHVSSSGGTGTCGAGSEI